MHCSPLHKRTFLTPLVSALALLAVAPIAGATDPTGSMATPRFDHMAAKLPDGRVLVAGGTGANNTSTATVELYDAATGSFTYTAPLVTARSEAGIGTLADGRIFVVGGSHETSSGGEFLRSAEIYDPATASWTVTAGSLTGNTLTSYPTTVALQDGHVLVIDGSNSQIFDPASGMFTQAIPLTTSRYRASAALLPDGRVLLAGGQDNSNAILASADVWNPATNTWSPTNAMATPRTAATATRLADGRILVAGGLNSSGKQASAEIFDPATQTFAPTGALALARASQQALALNDGSVLVAGGYTQSGVTSSLERYYPATGTWTSVGALATARNRMFTATLLNNGNVLFTGGPGPLATAELYVAGSGNVPPVANFTQSISNLTVTFTDASSDSDGSVASRAWTFGDGTTSTATSPVKTYATAGTYSVTLSVTDNAGATNTVTKSISVGPPPNVAPVANFSSMTSGLTATFTDSSTDSDGTIVSRSWNFGDGTTSTATSPSKTYATAGTYTVTLTVTDNAGATNTKTASVTVVGGGSCGGTVLCNGVAVTNLSAGAGGTTATYTLVVPAGATNLTFVTSGGTGDADLYVKFGSAPTTTSYDCRPYIGGNAETCTISNVQAGTYYVVLRAFSAFSGVSLTGSYTTGTPGCSGTVLCNGVAATNLAAASGQQTATYTLVVPAGATNLKFVTSGGVGDADLYVKFGSAPTASSYDCRPYQGGNAETCAITNVQAGTYYVMLRAYSSFNGVSLTGSYTSP